MILFQNNMPQLDLHGEDRIGATIKVKTFLDDNYKLNNREVAIVHGIGKGILKKEVLNMLKKDKRIEEYNLDMFNEGCTLVRFYENVDKKLKKCYNTEQIFRGSV